MIKIGLIGAGHLGKIHLKLIDELDEFKLVGIFDIDENASSKAAKQYNCRSFSSIEELIAETDAIDIVSPTQSHYQYAKQGIKNGKHIFVEKPLCKTIEEAEELLTLAEEAGIKAQVGHVERFNPAVLSLKNMSLNPRFIEVHRLAYFNPRGTDVAVILDLMIHDIDLVLSMVKAEVKKIDANGVTIISNTPDIANARIEFDNGSVANLTASRVSLKRMRKMRIFQSDAYISLDLLEKKSEIVRLSDIPLEGNQPALEINTGDLYDKKYVYSENPKVEEVNSIKYELRLFANSITENTEPAVGLVDAYRAMDVAIKILSKINTNNLVS